MYYPTRMVRTDHYKLILNIAYPLLFPVATDLYKSSVWQRALRETENSHYGLRTVPALEKRPQYELYDLVTDPHEVHNVAADPAYAFVFQRLQKQLHDYQAATHDPWLIKYDHE